MDFKYVKICSLPSVAGILRGFQTSYRLGGFTVHLCSILHYKLKSVVPNHFKKGINHTFPVPWLQTFVGKIAGRSELPHCHLRTRSHAATAASRDPPSAASCRASAQTLDALPKIRILMIQGIYLQDPPGLHTQWDILEILEYKK